MRYLIIERFLSKEQCEQLIEMAKPRLEPSKSWNVTRGESEISDHRKSEQMFFARAENPLIAEIEQKIATITNIPVENGENIQLVHYPPGGYFKYHHDGFDEQYAGNKSQLELRGGQRVATFMIYLNTVLSGGATVFPKVGFGGPRGLEVVPVQGRALMWYNVKQDDGRSKDETAYHSAEPVLDGNCKYIITKWLRQRPFQ